MIALALALLLMAQVSKTDGTAMTSGGAPTMGACGTTPSVTGTDTAFTVTVGSGVVTSCVVNFSGTLSPAPRCVVASNSLAISTDIATLTASAITFGFSATFPGGLLYALCM